MHVIAKNRHLACFIFLNVDASFTFKLLVEVPLLIKAGDDDKCNVEKLMEDIDNYVLASHIHWGLWGILYANVAEIDFDYLGYARERFRLYYQHC